MDVKVLVMARTNGHALDQSKEGGRWRQFDPVDVLPIREALRGPNGSPAFWTVYIDGFPGDLAAAREAILADHRAEVPHARPGEMVARRRFPLAGLAQGTLWEALQRDLHITLTWPQFQAVRQERAPNSRDLRGG